MAFLDQARIHVKAGGGGNGVVSFRREIYIPRGGPNGGNGGRGGHAILVADPGLNTLFSLHNQVHFRAERGGHGGGADRNGANGADLLIPVPVGTVVRNAETGETLADLAHAGQRVQVARGGRGGRGNAAFKSARNKAPRLAEKGEPGEELWLDLELKLVADVGIIGAPNAGKSTLLSVLSAAKPKIADYPFTTTAPILGVAEVNHQQIVFADIPGLLEGAHEGVGLGLDFLRHIERTRIVIHVLAGDSPDPLGDYEAINQELELFNPQLIAKPQIVAFNKMDLPQARAMWPTVEQALTARGIPVFAISAAARQHVDQLLYVVKQMLDTLPQEEAPRAELPEIAPPPEEGSFEVHRVADHKWYVEGVAIERAAAMTNWNYYEAAMRFQRILQAMGITERLRNAGVQEGDTVRIGETELVWGYENAFGE
jgi:GTP-binding protein